MSGEAPSQAIQVAGAAAALVGRLLFGVALAFAVGEKMALISVPQAWVVGGLGLGAGLLAVSMGLLRDGRRLAADFFSALAVAALLIAGAYGRAWYLRRPYPLSSDQVTRAVLALAVFGLALAGQFFLRKPRR